MAGMFALSAVKDKYESTLVAAGPFRCLTTLVSAARRDSDGEDEDSEIRIGLKIALVPGQPKQLNGDTYLAGGMLFGPFVSRNLTPGERGKPAGLSEEQFNHVPRSGVEHSIWVEFARSMAAVMYVPAQELLKLLAHEMPMNVLGIAAGHGMCGITIIAIAPRHRKANIVALDFLSVLTVAKEDAGGAEVSDRYRLLLGSAFEVDYVSHEDKVSPCIPAWFALIRLAGTVASDTYTISEHQSMLHRGGLSDYEVCPPNSDFFHCDRGDQALVRAGSLDCRNRGD